MHPRWSVLVALMAVASPAAAQGQSGSYWLITQATGRWEYRVGTGQPRRLTGSYDYLVPAGQVRCLEPDVRRCELQELEQPDGQDHQEAPRFPRTGRRMD